jgi:hypothetical protein
MSEAKRPSVYVSDVGLASIWQAGFSIRTTTGNGYRKRALHTLAKDLKLPKLTFQMIRKTIATLAQKKAP